MVEGWPLETGVAPEIVMSLGLFLTEYTVQNCTYTSSASVELDERFRADPRGQHVKFKQFKMLNVEAFSLAQ